MYFAFILGFFCYSCSETEEITSIKLISNTADFVVTNKKTSQRGKNHESGFEARNGDVIELTYTPKDEYKEYSWKVDFDIFDNTSTITQSPYTTTFTVQDEETGTYAIECFATIDDNKVISNGFESGSIQITIKECCDKYEIRTEPQLINLKKGEACEFEIFIKPLCSCKMEDQMDWYNKMWNYTVEFFRSLFSVFKV